MNTNPNSLNVQPETIAREALEDRLRRSLAGYAEAAVPESSWIEWGRTVVDVELPAVTR